MQNFGIKFKLILLFLLFKVIPVVIISFVAIEGALELKKYFETNTKTLFEQNKKLIDSTANIAIEDSIKALDKTSQTSIEKLSVTLASRVADFLYERDRDILFLSSIDINQKNIESFFNTKTKPIVIHEDYNYDENNKKWISTGAPKSYTSRKTDKAQVKDNEKEFHFVDPLTLRTKNIPIYKEITFFDNKGHEVYKKSTISNNLTDVSKKENTYIKAEEYFSKIQNLKAGEIYVSDVIGEYVPSKIIGTFTKEKAAKMGVEFKPELHGYAGVENPKGKKFDGIVRYVTPVFKGNHKLGYISLALDHRHIMEFTDTFDPVNPNIKQNIANAGAGNYAFMWDYEGRNISHPRDYFIVGYDSKTGQRVPGWLSAKIAGEFKKSGETDLNKFLDKYPTFDNQSLKEKPNIAQLKEQGQVGLDCRYLNFAPQCQGWMQLTQNGGYGSFVIFWSKVWKLSTAATIPYYTGQYANSKRGFGFVTIGANVDEFHDAANKTKENIDKILISQNKKLESTLVENENKISGFISSLINELSVITVFMVLIVIFIAIWLSNYITKKIEKLIIGTQHFAQNDLDYKIEVSSKDEVGKLETAFNEMAGKLKTQIETNKTKDSMLIQKNKMAEMGDMMSAILHQWKQPLNAITMTTSSNKLLYQIGSIPTQEDIIKGYEGIEKQVEHMSQTMNDFKNFFRPSVKKELYSLSDVSQNTIRMIEELFSNYSINIVYTEKVDSNIEGYPTELMQVFLNILNNAKDAIVENKPYVKDIYFEIDQEKEFAVIKISDLAGGIKHDIKDKIFNSYFTTKPEEIGTGIGLHMSRQIITKAGGEIDVENQTKTLDQKEYKGAVFIIKLIREKESE